MVRVPTHPGDMLLEAFLIPMELTQRQLATAVQVLCQRVNEIISGKRGDGGGVAGHRPATGPPLRNDQETVVLYTDPHTG